MSILKSAAAELLNWRGVYEGAAGADYCDPTRENTTIPPHGKFQIKQWKHNPDTGRAFVHRRMESRMGGRVSLRMGVTQSGSQMDIVRLLVKRKLCGQMLWVLFSGTLASIGLEHIYVFWSIFGGKLWRLRVCFTNFMQKICSRILQWKHFLRATTWGFGWINQKLNLASSHRPFLKSSLQIQILTVGGFVPERPHGTGCGSFEGPGNHRAIKQLIRYLLDRQMDTNS